MFAKFMMIPTANSDLLRLGQTLKEGTIVLWRCMCRSATKTILMVLGVMAALDLDHSVQNIFTRKSQAVYSN